MQTTQAVDRFAAIIPKEYKPRNLKKLFKRPKGKSLSEEQKKRVAELQESSMMMANSSKNMSMAQMKKMELIEK